MFSGGAAVLSTVFFLVDRGLKSWFAEANKKNNARSILFEGHPSAVRNLLTAMLYLIGWF